MVPLVQIHSLATEVADCFERDHDGILHIAGRLSDAPDWVRDLFSQLFDDRADHEYLWPVFAAYTFIAAHDATEDDAAYFAALQASSSPEELLAWLGARDSRRQLVDEVLAESAHEPPKLVETLRRAQDRELQTIYLTVWGFLRDMVAVRTQLR
jgi:hypothetical protein